MAIEVAFRALGTCSTFSDWWPSYVCINCNKTEFYCKHLIFLQVNVNIALIKTMSWNHRKPHRCEKTPKSTKCLDLWINFRGVSGTVFFFHSSYLWYKVNARAIWTVLKRKHRLRCSFRRLVSCTWRFCFVHKMVRKFVRRIFIMQVEL